MSVEKKSLYALTKMRDAATSQLKRYAAEMRESGNPFNRELLDKIADVQLEVVKVNLAIEDHEKHRSKREIRR